MSDITELERRITAAMDRIAKKVEDFGQRQTDAPDPDAEASAAGTALNEALEEEKLANAQLQERLKVLHIKLDKKDAETEQEISGLKSALADMETALEKLKSTSEDLRSVNQTLRDAQAEDIAAALDAGLRAELEALRAERAAEAAETQAIAAALEPLIDASKNKETA
ncbi:hypothetical protein TG4357_00199 [Thalassovita gelatinovora]|uniref:Uncharacterized protein n=1 Tax=Thalassovita gelatinovora TaxID=53501 RepID=A0A0P1F4C5_THAGE|nr:hypothetical protein [Thalassovita gelatinovora]QIZ79337.1 hypothetical protein HFZ77_02040 [Thalassovita gelatinovora]CUH62601.1 hypothetical protein TG4357_00199 [Thalassovita gelatinovora]SEQ07094.1 hypothetical protein SAMN04488043_10399 [Thalassovita gelatinovora]